MLRPIDNPPNPWHASDVEWVGPPPETDLVVSKGDRVRYHWRKGDPWPRVAKEEFWLR